VLEDQRIVLRSIIEGRLDHAALRRLPAMHAALVARVAWKAGVMARADLDQLTHEVHFTGALKPYREPATRSRGR
jgi:hypothetical protein